LPIGGLGLQDAGGNRAGTSKAFPLLPHQHGHAFFEKGKPYKDLTPSYVIFICMKDPFEKDEAIYQFQMIDKNLQLQLNEETYIMSLSQRLAS